MMLTLSSAVAAVAVHDQRDMFEEARHVLELAHGADELLQVFEPALRFRALVVLPHLPYSPIHRG